MEQVMHKMCRLAIVYWLDSSMERALGDRRYFILLCMIMGIRLVMICTCWATSLLSGLVS